MTLLDRDRARAPRKPGRKQSGRTQATGTARSRRRFARRQWARRWLTWRYLVVALVLALMVGGSVYAVYFSPWLRAEQVDVAGTGDLTSEQVLAAARVPLEQPLATVDLEAVEVRVRSLAAVRDVEVRREWPHTVAVTITEREPVAVISVGTELRALDAEGVIFGSYDRPPSDLPRVESPTGTSGEARREAATVAASLEPAFLAMVDHLEVESIDRISLVLRDERVVRWGSSERSDLKAEVLADLLSRPGPIYDVSVPSAPVTSPR